MDFGRALDRLIEPFSPSWARKRAAQRLALAEVRQYEVAAGGRRTQGWRRPSSSADREVRQGMVKARDSARDLVRNNKYAASALRQITANLVGDGIAARATHMDPAVAERAQAAWDEWAAGPVDGRNDFYGVQKLAVRAAIEGGESLIVWKAGPAGPDSRCQVLEGDHLDHMREDYRAGAGRIVQGVELDADGFRDGYWLLDDHPGAGLGRASQARRWSARDVDHVFEELRPGQTRGVSWFAPVAMDLRDLADYEDAVQMKKKVEACLALILTPGDDQPSSPLAGSAEPAARPGQPPIETLRPGMIYRARAGDTAHTLSPSSSGDGVEFVKQRLAGISANLAPYHLLTGDVSNANYSSLRAALLGFWANLDDWQQNMVVPFVCAPAFRRQMERLALRTGDRRFRQVGASWAMPVRRFVDPIKDVAGELAEIRSGFKSMPKALSERGLNWAAHLAEVAEFRDAVKAHGLALECDPATTTQSGVLQAAVGYLAPQGSAASD